MTKPRIKLPDIVRLGEIIEIKALISHQMETGQRRDAEGQLVHRHIVKAFAVAFNGQPVFSSELQPGLSANPFIAFTLKVPGPGDLEFTWTDDLDVVVTERQTLKLT
jgi:sulfur-oxidizing protein SoxZ